MRDVLFATLRARERGRLILRFHLRRSSECYSVALIWQIAISMVGTLYQAPVFLRAIGQRSDT